MKQLCSFLATPLLFLKRIGIRKSYQIFKEYRADQKESEAMLKALSIYFSENSPELVKYFHLMIFQCWSLNDCNIKAEVTDKDFALFLDQLNDLVEAAHRFHQFGKKSLPIV